MNPFMRIQKVETREPILKMRLADQSWCGLARRTVAAGPPPSFEDPKSDCLLRNFTFALVWLAGIILAGAQTTDFGDRVTGLRCLGSEELAKPFVPADAITNPPPGSCASCPALPLSLVYRYYANEPWLATHVRSVFSSVPGFNPAAVEIDTGGDNPGLQVLTTTNEARLSLPTGTAVAHPAYGLYCLRVTVPVPFGNWADGVTHQFFVRLHHRAPPVAWSESWWYFWRTPSYVFRAAFNGVQQVPPNSSIATGSGMLYLDPVFSTLGYDLSFTNLVGTFTAAHIHGPAGAGTNAGVIFPLTSTLNAGSQSGRLYGVTPPLSATQLGYLRNRLLYLNVHSATFPNGEIRGQIAITNATSTNLAYRPTWIPHFEWSRAGTNWSLKVTDPYGFGWDPWFRPRPLYVYGVRSSFTAIGSVQTPAQLPFIAALNSSLSRSNWVSYPKPPLKGWAYRGNSTRWHSWGVAPFSQFHHLPPIIQLATWINPDMTDGTAVAAFPDDPVLITGTAAISTIRALVSQPGDLTGDGLANLTDLSAFRQEQGTASQDTQDRD
jgi:hypothetical protein